MNELTLSVIIPVYNAAKTIRQSIDSVLREIKANNIFYEIIIVDDGSTDNSMEICSEFADTNKNIKIISQENSGPSAARNNGIKAASGEFIALNDSDDKWLPGKLKVQLELMKSNPDIDLVCSKYGICRRLGKKQEITFKKEVFHNFFSPQTSIFRKKILTYKNIQFPEKQKYAEDMRFLLNVMRYCRCMYIPFLATVPVIPKCVFGEAGLSSHIWEMEKGELNNILYVFQIRRISFFYMGLAILWSLIKFSRRAVISFFIKQKNLVRKANIYIKSLIKKVKGGAL